MSDLRYIIRVSKLRTMYIAPSGHVEYEITGTITQEGVEAAQRLVRSYFGPGRVIEFVRAA